MVETLRNCWRVPELRKKILYTLGMLLIYRLAGVIPVAGVNIEAVQSSMSRFSLLDFMSMMTGNQFSKMTIMAMGITPYINSSIIMQLLTVAIPALERLQKEGEEGRKKIASYTRYLTVALGFIQAVGLVYGLGGMRDMKGNALINGIVIGLSMAAGSTLSMWIGEHITENGVGNGVSLLIFSGIITNLFTWTSQGVASLATGSNLISWITMVLVLAIALIMIVSVTYVDMGERRIQVTYAKKVVGRRMMGGQSTYIPMKVNSTGVLPLIFAYSIMQFPGTVMGFWPNAPISHWWNNQFLHGVWYQVVVGLMILFFTYFYTSITFNPQEISKNLQQNGGTIRGIRQGKPTVDYLSRTSSRVTLFGGVFLAILATIPTFATRLLSTSIPFAATSLLIAVSVALETTRSLESQLIMRHYNGFL